MTRTVRFVLSAASTGLVLQMMAACGAPLDASTSSRDGSEKASKHDPHEGIPDAVFDHTDDEAHDADGYCFFDESGYAPCDDGAPPGSGGVPPPGSDGEDDGSGLGGDDGAGSGGGGSDSGTGTGGSGDAGHDDGSDDSGSGSGGDSGSGGGPPPCVPHQEICGDGVDQDCNGIDDACDPIEVEIDIDGDCVTASCPDEAPYPVGCDIDFDGGDPRGCIASRPDRSELYFQEGDQCHAGHLEGVLYCSTLQGQALNEDNCPINKSDRFYVEDDDDCPETDD